MVVDTSAPRTFQSVGAEELCRGRRAPVRRDRAVGQHVLGAHRAATPSRTTPSLGPTRTGRSPMPPGVGAVGVEDVADGGG